MDGDVRSTRVGGVQTAPELERARDRHGVESGNEVRPQLSPLFIEAETFVPNTSWRTHQMTLITQKT